MGRKPVEYWKNDDLPASAISLDPRLQLAAGVLCQAFRDVCGPDPELVQDAILWWVTDGEIWCESLGYEYDPALIFQEEVMG